MMQIRILLIWMTMLLLTTLFVLSQDDLGPLLRKYKRIDNRLIYAEPYYDTGEIETNISFYMRWFNTNIIDEVKRYRISDLNIDQIRQEDMSRLEGMSLEGLSIGMNREGYFGREYPSISNVDIISNMPLSLLAIRSRVPLKLSTIAMKTNLVYLYLETPNNDFKELSTLKNLKKLTLIATNMSDISWLRSTNLVELDISGSKVENIDILKNIPLKELHISDTKVADLGQLSGNLTNTLGMIKFTVFNFTNGLEIINRCNNLNDIIIGYQHKTTYSMTREEFWKRYRSADLKSPETEYFRENAHGRVD